MNANRKATGLLSATTFGAALAVATVLLAYCHARYGIDAKLSTVLVSIYSPDIGDPAQALLHYLRLPRTLAAIVTGACLAAAGTMFQAAVRNPLASPGILGVTAGAQLVVALVSIVPLLSFIPHPIAATVGGLAAGSVTFLVAKGGDPVRIALSGMAVSLMAGALAGALALLDENAGASLYLWGGGSLVQSDWTTPVTALYGLVPALAMMMALARHLDILALGDDTARMLGQNVFQMRLVILSLGIWVSALAVTIAGPVVFVGLVAPNLVRLAGVSRHGTILPLAVLTGIFMVIAADLVALHVASTSTEMPLGVPLAIVGAPFLIGLAWRLAKNNGIAAEAAARFRQRRQLTGAARWAVPLALLGVAICFGLMAGNEILAPDRIVSFFIGHDPSGNVQILTLRLMRVAGAALAGALLGLSGLVLQGVVRNPLASPELIGVTQLSGFMAVVAIVLFPATGFAGVQLGALTGGLLAAAIVGLLGLRMHLAPSAMALIGLGLAAMSAAGASALVIGSGFQASQAATWLAGSTYGAGMRDIVFLALVFLVLTPVAYLVLSVTELLAFGREKAASLGMSVAQTEWAHLVVAAFAASAVAAIFGPVSFVGLMAPHAAKLICDGRQKTLLLPTLLCGATLMVVADLFGRSLFAPVEIPVGLMTAILGAPFILLVLRRG